MNSAFEAGARAGMMKVAMEDKEAMSFAPMIAGAKNVLTRAQPFVNRHLAPAVAAAHSGSVGGISGAVAGGVSSLMGTGGRALAKGGVASGSPLKQRLGKVISTFSPAAQAFG
jgi:hypothetical protein